MSEPTWLAEGRRHLGLAEVPGKDHNPTIASWLKQLGAWYYDDEAPWCGTFVAYCMRAAGIATPKVFMRAKAWADWGQRIGAPAVGCVVVFERVGGGHVGLVVGRDQMNRLVVLGGNQGNKVSVAPFDVTRVIAYRWPADLAAPVPASLPIISSTATTSTNEA